MLAGIQEFLRRRARSLKPFVKWAFSVFQAWPVPIPRAVGDRWLLTHPALWGFTTEPHVVSWTQEAVRRGDTFFDVGAHGGWISIVASRRVGREGRVVAFEPSPFLARILRRQRQMNFAYNVTVEAAAVSDVSGTALLYLHKSGNSSVNSIIEFAAIYQQGAGSPPESLKVEAWSIDDYCRRTGLRPSAIKIDVEGAELMVLRGAREVMRQHRPVLILAVHPPLIPGHKADELFSMLDEFGYKIHGSHTVLHDGSMWGDYLLR